MVIYQKELREVICFLYGSEVFLENLALKGSLDQEGSSFFECKNYRCIGWQGGYFPNYQKRQWKLKDFESPKYH